MFRRSSNLRKLFGDFVSPEGIASILNGTSPAEEQQIRTLGFVWIWLTEEQVAGPEIGSVADIGISSGSLIEIFPPVAAFWSGHFEGEMEADLAKLVEDLSPFTVNGAKLIIGTTTGSTKNIGSEGRWTYSVLSPDRATILSQLAIATAGSVNTFETNANTGRQATALPSSGL
jgi:hypothetical protein